MCASGQRDHTESPFPPSVADPNKILLQNEPSPIRLKCVIFILVKASSVVNSKQW